jgi:DNA-binding NarL/FixJ family response regulator
MDLFPREREVIHMLIKGFLYKEIADTLNISVRTVDTYIRRIYEKLHVRSRAQAVAKHTHFLASNLPDPPAPASPAAFHT